MEWIFHSFFVINALAYCGLITFPIDFLASMVVPSGIAFETEYGPVSLFVAIYPFVVFVFFPIFLLSMLESASRFIPYSQFIMTSFRQIPGTWLRFYGLSFALQALVYLLVVVAAQYPNRLITSMAMVIGVTASMIYFRLLGRLSWLIGEKVEIGEDELEPDRLHENAEESEDDLLGDPASPSVV